MNEVCFRSQAPLTVAEQRRRYRRRENWPDWVWAVIVGLLVSAVVVGAILLTQTDVSSQ